MIPLRVKVIKPYKAALAFAVLVRAGARRHAEDTVTDSFPLDRLARCNTPTSTLNS